MSFRSHSDRSCRSCLFCLVIHSNTHVDCAKCPVLVFMQSSRFLFHSSGPAFCLCPALSLSSFSFCSVFLIPHLSLRIPHRSGSPHGMRSLQTPGDLVADAETRVFQDRDILIMERILKSIQRDPENFLRERQKKRRIFRRGLSFERRNVLHRPASGERSGSLHHRSP